MLAAFIALMHPKESDLLGSLKYLRIRREISQIGQPFSRFSLREMAKGGAKVEADVARTATGSEALRLPPEEYLDRYVMSRLRARPRILVLIALEPPGADTE